MSAYRSPGSNLNNASALPEGLRVPPGGSVRFFDANGVAPATDTLAMVAVFDAV